MPPSSNKLKLKILKGWRHLLFPMKDPAWPWCHLWLILCQPIKQKIILLYEGVKQTFLVVYESKCTSDAMCKSQTSPWLHDPLGHPYHYLAHPNGQWHKSLACGFHWICWSFWSEFVSQRRVKFQVSSVLLVVLLINLHGSGGSTHSVKTSGSWKGSCSISPFPWNTTSNIAHFEMKLGAMNTKTQKIVTNHWVSDPYNANTFLIHIIGVLTSMFQLVQASHYT